MKTAAQSTRRILIVDDHAVVREGLARILTGAGEGWSVDEASSGFQALEWLRREHADLVIVDLSMPGMSGLELIRRIRDEFGRVAMLVLSMHAEEQYAMRAFKAGANGYITKDGASGELIRAARKVMGGGAYVTPELAERVVLHLHGGTGVPRHSQLSDRELEVLRRLVAGQRPTDIANALHLSVKTISTHKSRIQEKLDLHTLADLVRYGLEHGLASASPTDEESGPPASVAATSST
ncbi:response regulator transcription factor [uncultured Piscinibacter sp.]|uniref:response regulator n=1 Tax=uncultured Piscinibacter sp. TaxID=1131835 RepID=UPI00263968CF|nr:response regulator transcription factor [uncultured Piscinibacter sp.]